MRQNVNTGKKHQPFAYFIYFHAQPWSMMSGVVEESNWIFSVAVAFKRYVFKN